MQIHHSTYESTVVGRGYEKALKKFKSSLSFDLRSANIYPFDFLVPPYYFFSLMPRDMYDANALSYVLHIDKGLVDTKELDNLAEILHFIDTGVNTSVPASDIALVVQCFLPGAAQVFRSDTDPVLLRPAIAAPALSHDENGAKLVFTYAKDGRGMNIAQCSLLINTEGKIELQCKDIPLRKN